jgi:hypothetical protein
VLHVLQRDRSGQYWYDIPLARPGWSKAHRAGAVVRRNRERPVRPSWVGAHQDREGGLWFVSYSSGLWYLPANWRRFSVLSRRDDVPASIANAHVRGIAPSSGGDMWLVGTGGVLDRLDPETGAAQHIAATWARVMCSPTCSKTGAARFGRVTRKDWCG